MRVRFAPSPTGHLHVGNARTALFNWLLARGHGGTFVLRLEDTDEARSTQASADAILDNLRWLGLTWDEGPDRGGDFGPYRQTERLARYRAHAEALIAAGHAYYCFCSPADLEEARAAARRDGRTPQYPGTCRGIDAAAAAARVAGGEAAAIRFRVPRDTPHVSFTDLVRGPIATDIEMIGDFVLLRQNGLPAYNFAVVVDDLEMRVSDVVRGEDHVPNTPRQLLLYRALGASRPGSRTSPWCWGPTTRRCPSAMGRRASPTSGRAASCRKRCATTSPCSAGRPVRVKKSCRSTRWRGDSGWRTSPRAPGCSTPTNWRG